MKLFKKLGIALCIFSTAILSTGCFVQAGATKENSQTSSDSNYNIEFTAKYNSNEKYVDVTLVNNTQNKLVTFDGQHTIYQKNDNSFTDVTPSYATYATATNLMPFANNTSKLSFATYDTSDVQNIDESMKNTALKSGTYKISMNVNVYENVEYITSPDSTDGTTYPQLENATCKTVTLEAPFTIE